MMLSLIFILGLFYSTYNAYDYRDKEFRGHEYIIKPQISQAYWYADYYANSNQGIVKADFYKIDCHLTPNIIYWEPSLIQFGQDFTYDQVDRGMKYGTFFIFLEKQHLRFVYNK